MPDKSKIDIPTSIGSIQLSYEQVVSFSRDERGGVVITLKEMIGDIHLEIISGYSYKAFSEWFEANKKA